MTKRTIRTILCAAVMLLPALPPALAQDPEPWEFRVTPYLWAPTLSTDLAIGAEPPVSTDTSLLDVLDFAFLLSGEVRKGDWAVIAEFNYLALSSAASTAGGRFRADTELDGVMGGAALAWRFTGDAPVAADAFAGFRVWSLDAGIDFRRLPSVSRSVTFVDPIIGLRARLPLGERAFLDGLGEIGGFGAGSDFQWEVVGRVGYRITETVSLALGYRHLALDFDDDGLVLDGSISGPFLAVDFEW